VLTQVALRGMHLASQISRVVMSETNKLSLWFELMDQSSLLVSQKR
jgi:hypothetical protein